MVKNIIMGVLVVVSVALFFYGMVQQIEARRYASLLLEVEQKLTDANKQAHREKELADMARLEAEKQRALSDAARQHAFDAMNKQKTADGECQSQLKIAQNTAEHERVKAIAAEKQAVKQREMAFASMKEAQKHAKQMEQAIRLAEEAKIAAEQELEKLKKKN